MIGRSIFLGIALLMLSGNASAAGPSDAEVARAISRGVEFLKATQQDGAWTGSAYGAHKLGVTALCGLALMENGVPRNDPAIVEALEIVRKESEVEAETYDITLAILFLARQQAEPKGPNDAMIRMLAKRLIGGQEESGMWTYTVPREPPEETDSESRSGRRRRRESSRAGDNSNTQFGLLGVWAAGRHGVSPDRSLERVDSHFRSTQNDDGRWDYMPKTSAGSPAMNCAGLLGLAIAAARPRRPNVRPPEPGAPHSPPIRPSSRP